MTVRRITTIFLVLLAGCSQAPVRSTVDSYGEAEPATKIGRDVPHYFAKEGLSLLEKQAAGSCETAAKDEGVSISDRACPECLQVVLHARLAGTEQVIRSTPGYGSAWGIFGPVGVGYPVGSSITSSEEAGREITLQFFKDSGKASRKEPIREIQIRSVGKQNSFTAVAYEMCQAAFRDYPKNLSGKFYEITPRKEGESRK